MNYPPTKHVYSDGMTWSVAPSREYLHSRLCWDTGKWSQVPDGDMLTVRIRIRDEFDLPTGARVSDLDGPVATTTCASWADWLPPGRIFGVVP